MYVGNEVDSPEYELAELVKKLKDCNPTPALVQNTSRMDRVSETESM